MVDPASPASVPPSCGELPPSPSLEINPLKFVSYTAAGVLTPGTVAAMPGDRLVRVEHPTGTFDVTVDLDPDGAATRLRRSGVVRTARKLFDGLVWPRSEESG